MNHIANNQMPMKHRIKEIYDSLPNTEKKVAKYVIDNYFHSMLLSSVELANESGVSNSAVVRFAKSLGFHGYHEYKKAIRPEYTSSQKVYSSLKLMKSEGDSNFISQYLETLTRDTGEFAKSINYEKITEVCHKIHSAQILYMVGFGSDIVVTKFLENYLKIMGVNCVSVNEEGLALREKLFLLSEDDVVLMSCFPSMIGDDRWVASHCKDHKVCLISITDSEITDNLLNATHSINAMESTDLFFNSYVLPMILCNLLLLRYQELYPSETENAMHDYHHMMEKSPV